MKTSPSSAFTTAEEGTEKKPVNLFHLWRSTTHWRYTSGLTPIIYNGNTYVPAPLERGPVQFDQDIQADTMTFDCARTMPPLPDYADMNPIDTLWVTVFRGHWDSDPVEAMAVFTGLVKNVTRIGAAARVECVSLEYMLNRSVPRYRYQPGCNHTLYSTRCGVLEDSFMYSATAQAIDSTGYNITLGGSEPKLQENSWCLYGSLYFGSQKRTIVSHWNGIATIRYKILGLAVDDPITLTAGCDKNIETCRDKFLNTAVDGEGNTYLPHFFGFPYIQFENPVLRGQ